MSNFSATLNNSAAIAFKGVSVSYSQKPVLRDISLGLPQGVLATLVGPNGAGKSTFLKALLGLVPLDRGVVEVFGNSIDRHRYRVAYVPQTESVDWDFPITAREIVMMGRYPYQGLVRSISRQDHDTVSEALEQVGMTAYANRHIRQLSGGQQQRIFLARALAQQADLLLLDEPFSGVDVKTEATLLQLMRRLTTAGKTLLVVNHDLSILKQFDYIILLNLMLVGAGPVPSTATETNIRRTYGGPLEYLEQAELELGRSPKELRRDQPR